MTERHSDNGSLWRRWDLHLHSPGTKLSDSYGNAEDAWDRYVHFLEESPVEAFGITDYFSADGYFNTIDKYREIYPETKKVFFPNIEFRLVEAISAQNSNPNIHVIFDNNPEKCSREKIQRFLSNLRTSGHSADGTSVSCIDLATKADFESATISITDLINALNETFGDSRPYLIAFPAKNDGVRSTDSQSPRKVLITDRIDKASDLFFGDSSCTAWFLKADRYDSGASEPKPVVSGSDAHSFDDLVRLEGNVPHFEPTWIKGDLTFRGLCQIKHEPEARIFIGTTPPVEERKRHQATKFINALTIDNIPSYDGRNGQWFKNVELHINPELTAIIGNKGSGKSALIDIIGLLAHSKNEVYFSFLSNDKDNRKFKQRGYAENFNGRLRWHSGNFVEKTLDQGVDASKPESVRYLPQNYFEKLTNEIEIQAFRNEIEDVVFSHVDETERMGKTSFSELQEFKTIQSTHETSALKGNLRELNVEIVRLEALASPRHKKSLEAKLAIKRVELESLEKSKPAEVLAPQGETQEEKDLSARIAALTELQETLKASGREKVEILTEKRSRLQKLTGIHESVESLGAHIAKEKMELRSVCIELGLDIDTLVNADIKTTPIEEARAALTEEISRLDEDHNYKFTLDIDFSALVSVPDLRSAYAYVQEQANVLKQQLGAPQRKYQAYLDNMSKWNEARLGVIGDDEDPKPDTIKYLEGRLAYINVSLLPTLDDLYDDRKELCREIFGSKTKVLEFYEELKRSVEGRLEIVRTDNFSVNIDASFVVNQSFDEKFLSYVNKTKKGPFRGKNEPQQLISSLVSELDWNSFESVYGFVEDILGRMKSDSEGLLEITEQVADVKDFYDFLFSLEYFSARYELRLGDKNLNELSPGEKGLLLLVFYLQLDKDNIPLVIDQPEDNLDNESIFTVLAHCIREAKKNRQVILVTHNPNLAVGADAEQIVYVQLNKSDNYKFTYESGAIENPRINRRIVDVLEGTQPAFVKRRLKYQI